MMKQNIVVVVVDGNAEAFGCGGGWQSSSLVPSGSDPTGSPSR